MAIKDEDIQVETMRGQGPGGQHKNKTDSCVRMTHIPTGISVTIDGRSQAKNKALARKELEKRIEQLNKDEKAKAKKARRDKAVHDTPTIRTYDFKSGTVKDHRSGKVASLKDVLEKGKIEKLR